MKLLDYESQTTFWEIFSMTDILKEKTIRGIHKQAKAEYEKNCIYEIGLPVVVKRKYWYLREKQNAKLN